MSQAIVANQVVGEKGGASQNKIPSKAHRPLLGLEKHDDDISRKTRYTATTLIDNDLVRYKPATNPLHPLHSALTPRNVDFFGRN